MSQRHLDVTLVWKWSCQFTVACALLKNYLGLNFLFAMFWTHYSSDLIISNYNRYIIVYTYMCALSVHVYARIVLFVCVHIYIMCVYMHVCNIHICVQCSPWAKRSCCTEETAQGIGFDRTWLNFDWHHCSALSPECTQHFIKDLCFYECSPNVGPYLQPVSVSWLWLVFFLHFQLLPFPVHSRNAVKNARCISFWFCPLCRV